MTAPQATTEGVPNDAALPLVWIDGRRVDASAAGISPLDRGFTLADGLFETMRAYHGSVFRLDAHLRRLAAGAAVLGIPVAADVPHTVSVAAGVLRGLGWADAALRLTVTRGIGPRGLAPPVPAQPTVVLTVTPLAPREPLSARSVRVSTAPARRNEFAATAGVKTLAYVESVVALAYARGAGADDALFLDTAGHVCEATASNVFVVAGSTLHTPPRECGVLPGITRTAVLELAATIGLVACEDVLTPRDLADADEAFLTSSIRELAPIARVDDAQLPNGVPGPVTRRLAQAFAELVERECRP
ncbi:MAG TPA: aminotransferase class IV [Gemmatimonadaceae bacterium]|nr:aminotransferase class IV [Gemmatimonadaceae bacterium]